MSEPSTLPPAFFLTEGELFRSTELTIGPWSREHQHGGPPSALLTRALERLLEPPAQLVRIMVEFFRPVPIGLLRVSAQVNRPGKKVRLLSASLFAGDVELCRASALALRTQPLELPPRRELPGFPNTPEKSTLFSFPFFPDEVRYQRAIETRIASGTFGRGSMAAWMRLVVPVVAGERPSAWQQVMALADAGNGVGASLETNQFTFINPDLTVYLHRLPESEWLGLDADGWPEPNGIGLSQCGLFDERGRIGRSIQALVVDKR
jgi:hypothetical protein